MRSQRLGWSTSSNIFQHGKSKPLQHQLPFYGMPKRCKALLPAILKESPGQKPETRPSSLIAFTLSLSSRPPSHHRHVEPGHHIDRLLWRQECFHGLLEERRVQKIQKKRNDAVRVAKKRRREAKREDFGGKREPPRDPAAKNGGTPSYHSLKPVF